MPRDEATQIATIVKEEAKKLFGKSAEVIACGSYRRGRETCGDVDCLVTRLDDKPIDGMLEKLLKALEDREFLKERLAVSKKITERGCETYMGVCKVPKAKGDASARRIDIKVYPK